MKKLAVGAVFLLLDRLSKWYILNRPNLYLGDFVRLKLSQNKNFYFFSLGNNTNLWISLIGGIALILLLFFLVRNKDRVLLSTGILLVVVGGISNLFDRIYYGFVIDFIWIKILPISTFNLADVLIFLGMICLLINIKEINFKPNLT